MTAEHSWQAQLVAAVEEDRRAGGSHRIDAGAGHHSL